VGQLGTLSFRKALLRVCAFLGINPKTEAKTERADTLVFSDMLNYMDFRKVLNRFAKYLKPGAGLLSSICPIGKRIVGWLFLPAGSKLSGSLHWPTVLGVFRRELAPAAALFLTDRHLMLLAEEKSRAWFVKRDRTKYGAITAYCSRSRISGFQVQEHRRFHILELRAHGAQGVKKFQVHFPPEKNEEITKLLSQALPVRTGGSTSVTEGRR